ncbi:MAG: glycosyltransferase [Candidatus Rokubacteria bacterium]|nr:glycosyltransferase [Candidatus Rokubacteria bacterium]
MTPLASLIIPTFNRAKLVAEALESALAQTLAPLEVIVVDDGSTDDTPSVLARYAARVHCLRQPNRGQSAARNAGLATARAPYVAFLDDDDLLHPEKLARQFDVLERDRGIGWTYCDVRIENALTGETVDASERFAYHRRRLDGWLFPELVGGNFIPPLAVLARRSALEAAGPFDEHLTPLEDWDLWLRLSLVAPARYVPAVQATYRLHGGSMSRDRALMDMRRFQVLDKLRRVHPEALARLGWRGRRIIADVHNWFGYQAYARGDWSEARARLVASLRTFPAQRRAPMVLASSLVRAWLR